MTGVTHAQESSIHVQDTEAYALTPPRDLEGLRHSAMTNDRQRDKPGIVGLRENNLAKVTKEERLGQKIAGAARKDCPHAYSGAGLHDAHSILRNSPMPQDIWLNLPVKNIVKSTAFFTEIGFARNPG